MDTVKYKRLSKEVNQILMDWDPIGVSDFSVIADEYISYVPRIIKNLSSKEQLLKCLEDILTNDIGLSYDPTNKNHTKDIEEVCSKLMSLNKRSEK